MNIDLILKLLSKGHKPIMTKGLLFIGGWAGDPVTAIIGGSVLGAGASIFGASKQSQSAAQAGDLQYQAQMQGIAAQQAQFDKMIELQQPWIDAGVAALPSLQEMAGQRGPSSLYTFQQAQGEKAINRALAARGLQHSGAGIEAISDFTTRLGAEESQRKWDRMATLAGVGQQATGVASAGYQAQGGVLANMWQNIGVGQANTQLAQGQAWGQGMSNVANQVGQSAGLYDLYKGGYFGQSAPPAPTGMNI